ncbi:MAG: hypothetical protein HOW73_00695 [Polyangiaceae bacterium]|nr:hypothetical protein [Polyangiaceae bacterium]
MNISLRFVSGLLITIGALAACGDDTQATGGNGGQPPTTGGGGEGTGGIPSNGGNGGEGGSGGAPFVIPAKPELGSQIDRMGRPAINTALTGAFAQFNGIGAPTSVSDMERASYEDTYNQDSNEAEWSGTYAGIFGLNLAVIDTLDTGLNGLPNQQACENQPVSCGDISHSMDQCYATLASVLADDRLWLNTAGTNCSSSAPTSPIEGYLAVEFAFLDFDNEGCGGRRPIDDVIQTSYSVLTQGTPTGIDDNIPAPPGLHPETFPYLADPH